MLTLHDVLCFLDLSATDVAGKYTELLEITAGALCPERNASQLCDERRDIIVVDIAAALMVLLYITFLCDRHLRAYGRLFKVSTTEAKLVSREGNLEFSC